MVCCQIIGDSVGRDGRGFARDRTRGWLSDYFHHAVVAAFDSGMILVAWDQQESMDVAIREQSHLGDLSAIIDNGPIALRCQTRTGRQ